MKKLLLRTQGQADVILTKPLARLVVFASSRGSGVNSLDSRNKKPHLDIFFSVGSVDDVTSGEKADLAVPQTSLHFRQRIASIAGLIIDLDHANWPAISDAWDNLRKETKGTPLEKSVELLHEPIGRQHVHALAQTIDTLLRHS